MDTCKKTVEESIVQRAEAFSQRYIKPIAKELDESNRFPEELIIPMAREGFFGVHYPKEYGGGGNTSPIGYDVITALAKGSAGISLTLIVHWMAIDALLKFGSDKQKNHYLYDLIQGEKIAAYSISEFQAGSDASAITTTAVRVESGWILNGEKYFCTNGSIADLYVIACKTEQTKGVKGISLFLVEKDTEGFIIGEVEEKMGCRSSATTGLQLKNCFISEENLMGEENKGFKIAMYGLAGGRLGMAAMGIGIAQAAFEEACEYAKHRVAFGDVIGKLYSVQAMVSDMYVKIKAAELLVKATAEKQDTGENYATETSVAKLCVSETVNEVCHKSMQLFGGHGYMKNNNIERYARDGRLLDIGVGATEVLKMVVGSTVLNCR
ncbi:acyl-CoA dehydrogenase family protein [Clostridium sp. CF012]|uniref:acyl-CoA dehydrogenase family protein n=1 Tax=Clostridium sp. CF012 TaxID=2843319 RepID=UPI001C0DFF91|nr:acyl-CoA dehydrogenase family protein [Clostridium sp. CF012]MBU3145364.1 acyl-CoA dehydrogenase family protein [Clostridium sp. CF012]